ncbi:MAG: hypothetical protein ACPIOQ_66485 [Promethearchaeia archaeon]
MMRAAGWLGHRVLFLRQLALGCPAELGTTCVSCLSAAAPVPTFLADAWSRGDAAGSSQIVIALPAGPGPRGSCCA